MDEMIREMEAALRVLDTPYVVIGGLAASLLGKPRMTMDADVVVLASVDRIDRLLQSMKKHGFSITASSEPKIAARLQRGSPVKLRFKKRYSVDLRLASYSIDRQAIQRSKRRPLFDVELPVASAEDLIVYKLVRFDDIDQADIKSILVRRGSKVDVEYIRTTVRTLVQETNSRAIEDHLATALTWVRI